MNEGKHSLRILGLAFVATLAFSAFVASGAQAGNWFIAGTAFHGTQAILGSGGAGKLLSIFSFECSGSTFTGNITALTKGLVTVTFSGCELLEGTKLYAPCNINAADGKANAGKITANAAFTVFLHGGESYVLFEPDVAGSLNERTFTTINIVDSEEGSEECVLAGPKEIKGTQVALVLTPGTELLKHEIHAVSDAVRKALFPGDFLHIGANLATLDTASASVHLTSDANWSYR